MAPRSLKPLDDQSSTAARLQLAVASQNIAAAVPDPETMGNERGAASHQIAPRHPGAAVAEFFGGRPAGRQVLHIDGPRDRGRQAEKKANNNNILHAQTGSPFLADESCRRLNNCLPSYAVPGYPAREQHKAKFPRWLAGALSPAHRCGLAQSDWTRQAFLDTGCELHDPQLQAIWPVGVPVDCGALNCGSSVCNQINCDSDRAEAVASCGNPRGSSATLVSAPQSMQRNTHSSCPLCGSTAATCMFSLQRRQVGRSW